MVLQKIPQSFAMVQRLEAAIPSKIKMQLSKEDKEKYQRLLREGRIDLTKQGVYDPGMMRVLKKPAVRLNAPILNVHWVVNKAKICISL
jgi:hypothetical protein